MYNVLLENIDLEKLNLELSPLYENKSSSNHIWLQKDSNFLFDLQYTNFLLDHLNMFNSRIMTLKGKECYTWHRDQTARVHIPFITNQSCLFVLENKSFHLPQGSAYLINTTKMHTALNGNKTFLRRHIVGMINEMV